MYLQHSPSFYTDQPVLLPTTDKSTVVEMTEREGAPYGVSTSLTRKVLNF